MNGLLMRVNSDFCQYLPNKSRVPEGKIPGVQICNSMSAVRPIFCSKRSKPRAFTLCSIYRVLILVWALTKDANDFEPTIRIYNPEDDVVKARS